MVILTLTSPFPGRISIPRRQGLCNKTRLDSNRSFREGLVICWERGEDLPSLQESRRAVMRDFLKTQELYVNGLYILRKLIPKYLCPENLILSAIVADMVHQVISSYAIPETFSNHREWKKIA